MQITKQQNKFLALAADNNPHTFYYKVPGISAWAVLIIFCALAVIVPTTALLIARVLAIYMLIRFVVIAVFYISSLVRIKLNESNLSKRSVYEGLTSQQKTHCLRIHHVVIIPNYKEPFEVLERTLTELAKSPLARQQITPVLAMEESECEAPAKARQLAAQFEPCFAHFLVTYHPSKLSGEIPGKGANQTWAARRAKIDLVDRLGLALDDITITTCDADSLLHPHYFGMLTRRFVLSGQRLNTIWQSPLFYDLNIWQTTASVRLLTYFANAIQVSELGNPLILNFPLSTYSLSLRLVTEVDYWDPLVIGEDWHMFLRCFFAKSGNMKVDPIFLPTIGEPVVGVNTWDAWANFYKQRLRHSWGIQDISYILQQWNRHPNTPFLKKFGRLTKIWHDNMVFSTGAVITLLGTLLSILIENNPVITIPRNYAFSPVFEIFNGVGLVGMLTIWLLERLRSNDRRYSWKLMAIISEAASWAIFPVVGLVLAGLPVIQAQTMLLFGKNLTYERTPKGILPKSDRSD